MDHIAIMVPGSQEIARGFKTIETRFSRGCGVPYNRVSPGDTIYFKDFGGPVCVRAGVQRVEFYEDLSPDDVEGLKRLYGSQIHAGDEFWKSARDRRYASLMFLADPEPFPPYWPTRVPFNRSPWVILDSPEKWEMWLGGLRLAQPHLFEPSVKGESL